MDALSRAALRRWHKTPALICSVAVANSAIRPPLKWAGGKYAVLPVLKRAFPSRAKRLIEPFVGSAVVFMNVQYPTAQLSDNNRDLVAFYRFLKEDAESFIHYCHELFGGQSNTREVYLQRRKDFNASTDARERSALLLYLNRHGYNGLYRVNSKGAFNVPFGRYKRPKFPEEAMRIFAAQAQNASISHQTFELSMANAGEGDLVYCDPPYVPLSGTADFTSYTDVGFGLKDQIKLRDCAWDAAARGALVIISNHDTELSRQLYTGARLRTFDVRRSISRDANNRGPAPELLAIFRPTDKRPTPSELAFPALLSRVERAVETWRTQLPEGEKGIVRRWTQAETATALIERMATAPAAERPHIMTVIGLIGDKRAAYALVRALDDPALRRSASQALARLGGAMARRGLLKRLLAYDCEDAATALGQLHELGGLDHLLVGLARADAPISRRRAYLAAAAQVVKPEDRRRSDHQRVVDAVLSAMDSELLREAACEAAAELGERRLIARLQTLETDASRRALRVIKDRA